MKKCGIYSLVAFLILLIRPDAQAQVELLRSTALHHFPSSSSLEFKDNRLYVIGDDATSMLVLDKDHKAVDSIQIFNSRQRRVPKNDKADLESTIMVSEGGKDYLVAFSSLSKPKRNLLVWIGLGKNVTKERSSRFRLRHPDIKEWNIEGSTLVGDKLVLSNRANLSSRINHLLVTGFHNTKGVEQGKPHSIRVELPQMEHLAGISSVSYLKEKDMLLFAASTEFTDDAVSDGSIGNSYIGYISGISGKLDKDVLKPDAFINVTPFLKIGQPQKIESIVVEEMGKEFLVVHLASDNDNGESMLFKLKWSL
jgi:hypothetical protein